jgi:membrane-associated phospholipid phosphatase
MGALASILAIVGPVASEANFFSYYVSLAIGPVRDGFFMMIAFLFVAALLYVAFSLIASAFYHQRNPYEFFSHEFLLRSARAVGRGLLDILLVGGPVVLTFIFICLIMAYVNPVNATRLIDDQVVEWDRAITGGYPFIVLQNIQYPSWFIQEVKFSFMDLPVVLIGFSLLVFFFFRAKFEEMAAVFCLNLVIMIFLWQIFPVLSPHDRFIDNVYQLPSPPAVEEVLRSNYKPQPQLQDLLKGVRAKKDQNLGGVMPTSTLPSAHVAWATLLVYFAYRTKKWFLIFLLPVALLSSLGTVLFAQHYFVDVPAGVLAMALSIYLVQRLGQPSGWLAKEYRWFSRG